MRQLSMSYDGKETWSQLLSALDNAVTHLGLKEVVYKLNVAKSTVCDALHDRNDRRWAQEWTLVVLEMLADLYSETGNQLARAILEAQAAATRRFYITDDDGPTPEEIAAAQRVLDAAKKRRRSA